MRLEAVYSMPGDQLATQMLSVRCSVFQWPALSREDRQKARLRLESYSDKVTDISSLWPIITLRYDKYDVSAILISCIIFFSNLSVGSLYCYLVQS